MLHAPLRPNLGFMLRLASQNRLYSYGKIVRSNSTRKTEHCLHAVSPHNIETKSNRAQRDKPSRMYTPTCRRLGSLFALAQNTRLSIILTREHSNYSLVCEAYQDVVD